MFFGAGVGPFGGYGPYPFYVPYYGGYRGYYDGYYPQLHHSPGPRTDIFEIRYWHIPLYPYVKNWDVFRCPSCGASSCREGARRHRGCTSRAQRAGAPSARCSRRRARGRSTRSRPST